jgi:hypothetical protein
MKKCQFCGLNLNRKEWQGKKRIIRESFRRFSSRKFCDNVCRSKQLSKDNSGEKNYFYQKSLVPWNRKSDQVIRMSCGNGYIQVRFFNNGKRVVQYEHRYLMEKKIGRELKAEEVVHHVDGNKKNNDLSNLILFENDREHKKHHRENRHKLLPA